MRPIVLRSIVASLVAAALVAVVSALIGEFGTLFWQAMGTACSSASPCFALVSWRHSAKRSTWFAAGSVLTTIYPLADGLAKMWGRYKQRVGVSPEHNARLAYSDGILRVVSWLLAVARIALLHIHLRIGTY